MKIEEPTADTVDLHVLDGVELQGRVNVDDAGLLENIQHSIRLGHPQVQLEPIKDDRVLLVGGGPSLEATKDELIDLHFRGAKIVALNNAAAWCLANNLRPSAQIIVDARPNNARFLSHDIPGCRYLLASQCAAETWAAVQGREHVFIWHAVDPEGTFKPLLDAFYAGQWTGIAGGTTAAMRGLALLRTLGYVRMDLFGIDSCWMDGQHHAYAQAENDRDQPLPFTVFPSGCPDRARTFIASTWHCKQLEDFLQLIRVAGDQFLLNVHGDGLLAFALNEAADIEWAQLPVSSKG